MLNFLLPASLDVGFLLEHDLSVYDSSNDTSVYGWYVYQILWVFGSITLPFRCFFGILRLY